jgi:O-antigen/teichoic acid export membrane protein
MGLFPAVVTTYVLTGYAPLLSVNLYSLAADSVIPGLAGIIGKQGYARAALIRREMLAASILFVTAAGTTVLLWNRSFVHLWVGGENYAGVWTSLLLVLIAAQTAFIRCDAYIIDAALQPGWRVRVSAGAALLGLGLSVVLTRYWGMVGLCLGIMGGRAIQTVWYPLLVRNYLQNTPELASAWLIRPFCVMLLLFAAAAYGGEHTLLDSWFLWAGAVLVTALAATGAIFALGLTGEIRAGMRGRALELWRRVPSRSTGTRAP